jgi:DNA-binding NarL/FixJ family response regulator
MEMTVLRANARGRRPAALGARPVTRARSQGRPSPASPSLRDDGWSEVVAGLRVAAVIISLEDLAVRAVTVAGRRLIGRPASEIVGRHIGQHVDAADGAALVGVLAALRAGTIDFYRAHLRGLSAGGRTAPLIAWVQALDANGRRVALAAWEEAGQLPWLATGAILGRTVAVAMVDASGATKIASIEREVEGLTIADLLRSQLVPAGALSPLLVFGNEAGGQREATSVGYRATITTSAGQRITLDAVCTALAGSTDRLVLLLLPDAAAPRVLELETHLRRIAIELEASGILARSASVPGLTLARLSDTAMLTARQREVLRRLVAGQRVRTIASELFVSQSTVRNHLSAIFDRFGVHSQAELLELVSETDESSP